MADPKDPWSPVIDEIEAMQQWYLPSRMSVSAWIGVDAGAHFFGGAHVEAEPLRRDDYDDYPMQADGETFEECATNLVRMLRDYRADRDRERAERDQERAARG